MAVGIAWNAGAVRARLISRHRLGRDAARDLARRTSLADAVAVLRTGPYADDIPVATDLPATTALARVRWAVAATPLWHLRVLAGWLPPRGGELVRTLAGWWEVLNVENHLAAIMGADSAPAYRLGRLETVWSRARAADTVSGLRHVLADSPWRDPGTDDVPAIVTWIRLSWAHRVSGAAGDAARLAAGWAALVAARELFSGSGEGSGHARRTVLELGRRWTQARGVGDLRDRLPRDAAWPLQGIAGPADLWRAEVRWWRELDAEGERMLSQPASGMQAVIGTFAVLLADAHRVQGALQLAAVGGTSEEVARDAL